MHRAGNDPEFFQVRREETAALLACAHAKFTGEVGVCLDPGTGGHSLTEWLVRCQARPSTGGGHRGADRSDVERQPIPTGGRSSTLFKDVAGAFVEVINDPAQVRHILDRAFRIAKAERTVTCVIIPHDVQSLPAEEDPEQEHGAMHSAPGFVAPRILPQEAQLQQAADVLNAGERVAVLIGAGALQAGERSSRSPRRWAAVWPRRCSERPPSRTICPL